MGIVAGLLFTRFFLHFSFSPELFPWISVYGTVFDIRIIRKTGMLPAGIIGKADLILGGYVFEGAVGIAPGLPLDDRDLLAQLCCIRLMF